jgi:hypothetical protein
MVTHNSLMGGRGREAEQQATSIVPGHRQGHSAPWRKGGATDAGCCQWSGDRAGSLASSRPLISATLVDPLRQSPQAAGAIDDGRTRVRFHGATERRGNTDTEAGHAQVVHFAPASASAAAVGATCAWSGCAASRVGGDHVARVAEALPVSVASRRRILLPWSSTSGSPASAISDKACCVQRLRTDWMPP